jgi:hypothetical protein
LLLDPGRHMDGLHAAERAHALRLAPGQELADGAAIGFARMAVADIGGEEVNEAARRRLTAGSDQRG